MANPPAISRKPLTVKEKIQLIEESKKPGFSIPSGVRKFGVSAAVIRKIIQSKEAVHLSFSKLNEEFDRCKKQTQGKIVDLENDLLTWYELQKTKNKFTNPMLVAKAKELSKKYNTKGEFREMKFTNDWIDGFKNRLGVNFENSNQILKTSIHQAKPILDMKNKMTASSNQSRMINNDKENNHPNNKVNNSNSNVGFTKKVNFNLGNGNSTTTITSNNTELKPYECKQHNFKNVKSQYFLAHYAKMHKGEKIPCRDCDYLASVASSFRSHEKSHLNSKIVAAIKDKINEKESNLKTTTSTTNSNLGFTKKNNTSTPMPAATVAKNSEIKAKNTSEPKRKVPSYTEFMNGLNKNNPNTSILKGLEVNTKMNKKSDQGVALATKTEKNDYECKDGCNLKDMDVSAFREHYKKFHKGMNLPCRFCTKSYKSFQTLQAHEKNVCLKKIKSQKPIDVVASTTPKAANPKNFQKITAHSKFTTESAEVVKNSSSENLEKRKTVQSSSAGSLAKKPKIDSGTVNNGLSKKILPSTNIKQEKIPIDHTV